MAWLFAPGSAIRPSLDQIDRLWSTPTARDTKGSDLKTRNGGPSLPRQVRGRNGKVLSNEVCLNPLFVEWLMGFPIGWTDCAVSGTAWSRWSRLMRSRLSQLERGRR